EDDEKIILANQSAFELRAVGKRDRDRIAGATAAAPTAGKRRRRSGDPAVLQRSRVLELPSHALEITRDRVARGAPRSVCGFGRFGSADEHSELDVGWIAPWGAALATHRRVDAVDVVCNRDRIGLDQRQRRIVLGNRGSPLVAVVVLKRDSRAE